MASSFVYASASGPGCKGRGTDIAGGTVNGGSSRTTMARRIIRYGTYIVVLFLVVLLLNYPGEPLHVESTSPDGAVIIRATSPSRDGTLLCIFSCESELLCPQKIQVHAISNTSGESHLISELRQASPDPGELWYSDVTMFWLADGKTLWIIYTSHIAGLNVATAEEFVLQERPPFAHKTGNVPTPVLDRLHIPY